MNYVVFFVVFRRMTPLVKKTLAAVSHGHILQRSKVCVGFVPNTGSVRWIVARMVPKAPQWARLAGALSAPLE
jgi:hypothetical protein